MKASSKTLIALAIMASIGSASATVFSTGPTANSTNLNTNTNTNVNTQGQQQGQAQGQLQGQAQGQGQAQSAIGYGGSASANNQNSVSNVVTVEAQERNPVSTATAPALSTSNGTCMGSTSAGAQGVSFGLSVGSTWVDAGCDARYDAEALRAQGQPVAAMARLCQKPEIAEAMKLAGSVCPAPKAAASAVAAEPQYTDPFIRRRLGLAPLN